MAKTDKSRSPKKGAGHDARAEGTVQNAGSIEEIVEAVNAAARAQTEAEIVAKKAAAKAAAKQDALVELTAAAAAAALRAKRSAKELDIARSAAKVAARDAKKAAEKLEKATSKKKSARKAASKLAEKTRAARERLDAMPTSDRGMVELVPEQPVRTTADVEAKPSASLIVDGTAESGPTDGADSASTASDLGVTAGPAASEEPDGEGEHGMVSDQTTDEARSADYLILSYGTGRHARTDDDITASGESPA